MVSFCGLTCHKCAIYLATREKDQNKKRQMRIEIAQEINEVYKEKFAPETMVDTVEAVYRKSLE